MTATMASSLLTGCGVRPLELDVNIAASLGSSAPDDVAAGGDSAIARDPAIPTNPSLSSGTESADQPPPTGIGDQSGLGAGSDGDPTGSGGDPTGSGTDPTGSGGDPGASGAVCSAFTLTTVMSTEPLAGFLPSKEWSFSANESTIYVHAALTGLVDSAHQLGFYFYVPQGYLYRHEFVKFKVGHPTGGIQGYPWQYVPATMLPEGAVVSYELPLTGPNFDIKDFAGGWRLTIVLDDDPNPIASVWFEIIAAD